MHNGGCGFKLLTIRGIGICFQRRCGIGPKLKSAMSADVSRMSKIQRTNNKSAQREEADGPGTHPRGELLVTLSLEGSLGDECNPSNIDGERRSESLPCLDARGEAPACKAAAGEGGNMVFPERD